MSDEAGRSHQCMRAVEYVRMSTNMQPYSIAYQQAANRLYAAQREMEIIRTYSDEARSGLNFEGRDALQQLLADAESAQRDFDVILVYDVSRWGRFQDTDESAYYEYRCKKAGVRLEYCAESFKNESGPLTAVLKAIKRAMAAEYSRELAVRTALAQTRAVGLGYLPSGKPGYALRRMLINSKGEPVTVLDEGEHKSLRYQRIVLVPGPPEEIATVCRIFELFVNKRMFQTQIAALLNRENVPFAGGRRWRGDAVHRILHNERYIGTLVYNRNTSYLRLGKLSKGTQPNDPSLWVRGPAGYKPIVPPALFAKANGPKYSPRAKFRNNEMLLDALRELLAEHGYLNYRLVTATKGMPSADIYNRRFGGLRNAYELIGYTLKPQRRPAETFARWNKRLSEIIRMICARCDSTGLEVNWDRARRLLMFANGFTAAVVAAWYITARKDLSSRWDANLRHDPKPNAAAVARLEPDDETEKDYFLLPFYSLTKYRPRFGRPGIYDQYRHDTLDKMVGSLIELAKAHGSHAS